MKMASLKKLIVGAALAAVVAFSATASACTIESKKPRAEITYSFNGEDYVVEYTLYRNMYPITVKHFIELADLGFYNNMIVHDYTTSDWFTGGYRYDEEKYNEGLSNSSMSDYYENFCKEGEYVEHFNNGAFTNSVYKRYSYDDKSNIVVKNEEALPTLYGEFSENGHEIGNNPLSASYGSLKMFYYEKAEKTQVYVNTSKNEILPRNYNYNCATSLFSVQVSEGSTYAANKYCVFATVRNNDVFEKLTDAVSDAFSGLSSRTVNGTAYVDAYESYSQKEEDKNIQMTLKAPKTAIVIKSVKITKY